MVGEALGHVAVSASLKVTAIDKVLAMEPPAADSFTFARIQRDRRNATARYLLDRDSQALDATKVRLDGEEHAAGEHPVEPVSAERARHYLEHLSELWADTEPEGRRAIAEAAFDSIEALGTDLVVHPSAEAERHGWSEAFGSEPLVCTISRYGRGERI
jgi:hypothetical protein